ncbi:shikimate 5-dehydrogenase [Betaproteobacteria bacterium]|nr:shikimate 5-dehydrogenase [Betaproteobacteria bacterium]
MLRGSTKLFPMLGTPLTRVRAPTLFSVYFEHIDADAVMIPMEVVRDFRALFQELFKVPNVAGAMITFPYKRYIDLIDEISPRSEVAQACNVVVKRPDGTIYGDIFDGEGFALGLRRAGFTYANARCLVIGCGGAGAAVAAALVDFGSSYVGVSDINPKASEELAERLNRYAAGRAKSDAVSSDPGDFDLVVNATPMGMKEGDKFSFDIDRLAPTMMVADLVMGQETALLRAAAARGCRTQPGTRMLFEQLSPVSQFWGYPPVEFDKVLEITHSLGWNA